MREASNLTHFYFPYPLSYTLNFAQMTVERPRILITNDDGYHSDGIEALKDAMAEVGDIYTVAPAAEQSGASHSLTLSRPLRIRQIEERHWAIDGTPSDCITIALNRILPAELRPDICVSGFNHGANLGEDATYSGTVAGAMEASILGLPGVAFSLVATRNFDFSECKKVAVQVVRKALAEGLPDFTLLNVNIPKGVPKGIKVTKQGFKAAKPLISEHIDPRGKPYYWIGEVSDGFRAEGGTDFEAIDGGYVSVTPMRADLTNYAVLEELRNWED